MVPVWAVAVSWRQEAACLDADPELFFPDTGKDSRFKVAQRLPRALQFCRSCRVVEDCLLDALDQPSGADVAGVRGGTLAQERKKLRRQRRTKGHVA